MSRRRSGAGGRRWRHAHPDPIRTRKRTTQQLLLTIAALVFLILFWKELSTGAAGCFTKMTTPQGQQQAPASGSGGTDKSSPTTTDDSPAKPPSVRIKLPDKKAPAPDAAP